MNSLNRLISHLTGLQLFGKTYSGLEYDYRGLLHIYEQINDNENYIKFSDILDEWRNMRSDEKMVMIRLITYPNLHMITW